MLQGRILLWGNLAFNISCWFNWRMQIHQPCLKFVLPTSCVMRGHCIVHMSYANKNYCLMIPWNGILIAKNVKTRDNLMQLLNQTRHVPRIFCRPRRIPFHNSTIKMCNVYSQCGVDLELWKKNWQSFGRQKNDVTQRRTCGWSAGLSRVTNSRARLTNSGS